MKARNTYDKNNPNHVYVMLNLELTVSALKNDLSFFLKLSALCSVAAKRASKFWVPSRRVLRMRQMVSFFCYIRPWYSDFLNTAYSSGPVTQSLVITKREHVYRDKNASSRVVLTI